MATGRRSFVRDTLGGALGAALFGARELEAAPPAADAWLDAIAQRKHKAFIDVGTFTPDGGNFRRTRALLRAFNESYQTPDQDIGVAFGAHSSALGYLLTPAGWEKLGVGDLVVPTNYSGGPPSPATVKDWAKVGATAVPELQQRGVKFLACRNTIARWADRIATKRGSGTANDVVAEIVASLLPGVEPVPAMIAAAVLAQERRLSYVTLG